jgi:Domain of unknown function (DUF4192)
MTETTPRRARGPADLLALVPSLFGFHPADSLVLLTVGDTASPFHARVDLPTDPCGVELVGAQLTETVQRNGTTHVVVVAYTGDAGLAHAVVDHLFDCLAKIGVELVCAVRADCGRWWVLPAWPDEEGTPYDVRDHPWTAQAVLDGNVVHASREELAQTLVGNDPDETAQIAALAQEISERLERSPGRGMVLEARWVRRRVRRFLRDTGRLDTHDVARLLVASNQSVHVRDAAWAEMTHANASVHVDLWRDAARRAPVGLRAPAATLLGFSAWLSGDGALAWCAVERALDADPGYSLASLLTQLLAGAVPPSSWQPIPQEELLM